MKEANYKVVLDTCVLANHGIPAFCSHVADSLGLNGDPDSSGSQ